MHIVTKILVILATILSVLLAGLSIAYTSNAQRIKGEGDAKATGIYARAYEPNPEFYSFYRSLEAYRSSFKDKKDLLVLDPNSEFFKYFKSGGNSKK